MLSAREKLERRVQERSLTLAVKRAQEKARVKTSRAKKVPSIVSFAQSFVPKRVRQPTAKLVQPKVFFSKSSTRRIAFTPRAWKDAVAWSGPLVVNEKLRLRAVLVQARLAHERPNLDLAVKVFKVLRIPRLGGEPCLVKLSMRYVGSSGRRLGARGD
jgi:hypothetical protein